MHYVDPGKIGRKVSRTRVDCMSFAATDRFALLVSWR